MRITDDPLEDFQYHEEEQDRWRNSRPMCDECGEHIQDDIMYEIGSSTYCESCIEKFRKFID